GGGVPDRVDVRHRERPDAVDEGRGERRVLLTAAVPPPAVRDVHRHGRWDLVVLPAHLQTVLEPHVGAVLVALDGPDNARYQFRRERIKDVRVEDIDGW